MVFMTLLFSVQSPLAAAFRLLWLRNIATTCVCAAGSARQTAEWGFFVPRQIRSPLIANMNRAIWKSSLATVTIIQSELCN